MAKKNLFFILNLFITRKPKKKKIKKRTKMVDDAFNVKTFSITIKQFYTKINEHT